MTSQGSNNAERIGGFQLIILILSVVILASMVTDAVTELPLEASRVLQSLDNVVCVLFLVDLVIRFRAAADKRAFMKWAWIDLLASIPNVDVLRWGRLVRVLRVIRLLRGIRSFQKVLSLTLRQRIRSGVGSVIVTSLLLITFASIGILMCETGEDRNIRTAEDALWWSITTITTVGYGDKFPITTEGRVIAMILMISGVGLFGTLSGLIASYFLGSSDKSDDQATQLRGEIQSLHAKIDRLLPKTTDEIEPQVRSGSDTTSF